MGKASKTASSDDLYRVILPNGSVAQDLVHAVGGGFRGIVRSGTSSKITGQVRLVPAAAGAGATVAAGPLIATVGLAIAGEMLAQHQMNSKLDAIQSVLGDIQSHIEDGERSILSTAAGQVRKVAGYLLDRAEIPQISSASHAFGELDSLANRYIEQLDRWSEVVRADAHADRVYARELLTDLVGKKENPVHAFELLITQTYEALALKSRILVLENTAADLKNPDHSLSNVHAVLHDDLTEVAQRQEQLATLLDDLSALQIDSSKVPVPIAGHLAGKGAQSARTSFIRLARAVHSAPAGIPVLTDSDQTVLDLEPGKHGLTVLAPQEDTGLAESPKPHPSSAPAQESVPPRH